MIHYVAVTKRL